MQPSPYLSPPRFRSEPLSDSFVRLIDLMFAVTMTQGFIIYRNDIVSPHLSPELVLLILVYATIILSWVGYHHSILKYPYNKSPWSRARLVLDISILLPYAFLVFAAKDLPKVIFGLGLVFGLYALDGLIRIKEWQDGKVSKPWLAAIFAAVFFGLWSFSPFSGWVLWVLPILAFLLLFGYRIIRHKLGYPRLLVLGIDVDGVLGEQVPAVLEYLRRKKGIGKNLTKLQITDWNFAFDNTDIAKEIEEALLDTTFVTEMGVVQGSTEAMSDLFRKFHVVIATSRPIDSEEATVRWLRRNFAFHEFANTRETGKDSLGLEILVDDNLDNVKKFAFSGGVAVLFSQPWNRADGELEEHIKTKRVVRCEGWEEVVRCLTTFQASGKFG